MDTQDSNLETQTQKRSQSQIDLQVERTSNEKSGKHAKNKETKAAGDVGEQKANANGLNNGLVTRFGRTAGARFLYSVSYQNNNFCKKKQNFF